MTDKAHRGGSVPARTNVAPWQVDLPPTCIAGLNFSPRFSPEY
jgi:hypothetical protein